MKAHAGALLIYAALTIAYTWPIPANLGTLVPHDPFDPLLSTWTLWWNAHVTPFSDRWWDGLAFFPARRTLTLSDHRVGIGLISTPAIWLGASPLAAHNLVFVLSFFLSAAAAYALCLTVTQSRAASFVAGLVFGFNPFRAHHLPHLELLSSHWLPIVLLALHQWIKTRQIKWLALLSVSLLMQALTSGYYYVFLGTLVALWLVWFLPWRLPLGQYVRLGLAFVLPLIAIAPVFLTYRAAHRSMGLARSLGEIERYSADVRGLIAAPRQLLLWNTPVEWHRPEGDLFPGAVAVVVVVAALWVGRRPQSAAFPAWMRQFRQLALAGTIVMAAVSQIPTVFGPVARDIVGLRISISDSYKPLSIAIVFLAIWLLTSARMREAWRVRSPFAFYILATVAMWLFALGPTARLLGERIFYKAPYSWLMYLPGFGSGFRVPARFGMLAALTLSLAVALAFSRLVSARSGRAQFIAAVIIGAAIVVESWIEPLPTVTPPAALAIPTAVPADAVILELPLRMTEDTAAMYHSIDHGRRTINGMSGFEPPHYTVLRAAMNERHVEVLKGFSRFANVAVFVPHDGVGPEMLAAVTTDLSAMPLAVTETHKVLLLPRVREAAPPSKREGQVIRAKQISPDSNHQDAALMSDANPATAWISAGSQRGSEYFVADLGEITQIDGVKLSQGRTDFPRAVAVDLSTDGVAWWEAWRGETSAKTLVGAIESPANITIDIEFDAGAARFIRVRQLGQSDEPWAVSEFAAVAVGRAAY